MILYKIGGLGADERVFKKLKLNSRSISINWLSLKSQESLQDYTLRLSKQIDQSQEFGIIGVSFGGIIAIELSKILNPKTVILISSVSNSKELPFIYLRQSLSKLVKLIPNIFIKPPQFIMNFIFGAVDKGLLAEIITDTDPLFIKWALHNIMIWNSDGIDGRFMRIHGTEDRLIPLKGNAHLINGGGHFMIVDSANEIAFIINQYVSSLVLD
ncbi:MAG: pimeloyl-ACP methyl ester carboxylesterase [Saprospiraceae bacterium]|jgi:pimeloyl-ACP methyl ester carboxylesterase